MCPGLNCRAVSVQVRLRRHLACHRAERPREYCDICYKEFRNKVSLRTHRNMVHKVNSAARPPQIYQVRV